MLTPFSSPYPLQPTPDMLKIWNFAWRIVWWVLLVVPRRFLIFHPKADLSEVFWRYFIPGGQTNNPRWISSWVKLKVLTIWTSMQSLACLVWAEEGMGMKRGLAFINRKKPVVFVVSVHVVCFVFIFLPWPFDHLSIWAILDSSLFISVSEVAEKVKEIEKVLALWTWNLHLQNLTVVKSRLVLHSLYLSFEQFQILDR